MLLNKKSVFFFIFNSLELTSLLRPGVHAKLEPSRQIFIRFCSLETHNLRQWIFTVTQ